MLQSISDCGRKLNESDVLQFEEMLGCKLPADYVVFLLQHNGGEPVPDCHEVQNTEGTNIGDFIGIRCLFSIGGPDKDYGYLKDDPSVNDLYEKYTPEELTARIKRLGDILNNWKDYKGRMPRNLLPIGCDDVGGVICLSLYGDDEGCIWYWDHEGEIIPPDWDPKKAIRLPDYSNCYKVADSFQEMLDGLFEYDFENNCRIPDNIQ